MLRTTIEELRSRRLSEMMSAERAEFAEALAAARPAIPIREEIRSARQAAGISQIELAARMSTSRAAVARLEAVARAATLTTPYKAYRCPRHQTGS